MANTPPVTFTEPPENTPAECDAVLGEYLRAWDQMEIRLVPLFSKMLGTHQNATLVILEAGINQPTLRDMLKALGHFRLTERDQSNLTSLLRRWSNASTKRNRIVHGNWTLSIKMVKGPSGKRDHTKSEWKRVYQPANPEIKKHIFSETGDAKTKAKYLFTLNDISKATADIRKLAGGIKTFSDQINPLPFQDPQHLALEQTTTQTQKQGEPD